MMLSIVRRFVKRTRRGVYSLQYDFSPNNYADSRKVPPRPLAASLFPALVSNNPKIVC